MHIPSYGASLDAAVYLFTDQQREMPTSVCLRRTIPNNSVKCHILGCGDSGVGPMLPPQKISKDLSQILAMPCAKFYDVRWFPGWENHDWTTKHTVNFVSQPYSIQWLNSEQSWLGLHCTALGESRGRGRPPTLRWTSHRHQQMQLRSD